MAIIATEDMGRGDIGRGGDVAWRLLQRRGWRVEISATTEWGVAITAAVEESRRDYGRVGMARGDFGRVGKVRDYFC